MSKFRFKKFTIYQDNVGMKVGTDSIILGSWIKIKNKYKHILDVGAGNGILSLMMAQKTSNSLITAVEIDTNAYKQAKNNISRCKWVDRIDLINLNAKLLNTDKMYDLIISNPPYYSNSQKSDIKSKNRVRHQVDLTFDELVKIWVKNGNNNANLACIYPIEEAKKIINQVTLMSYHLEDYLEIRPHINSDTSRACMLFSKYKTKIIKSEFYIHNEDNSYTEEYKVLTKDFYLAH